MVEDGFWGEGWLCLWLVSLGSPRSDRLPFLLLVCVHCLPLKHDLVGQPQEAWVEGRQTHLSVGVMAVWQGCSEGVRLSAGLQAKAGT